jgi:LPXTG-site transpeptidase (sortase) family protein
MKKGLGHIDSTSAWNSNVGLVGHNRGTNDYFGRLKELKAGDEMTYTTSLGSRTYTVQSVERISDTDWSELQPTEDNRLTLITCVEEVPSQRLCVTAVEKQ